MVTREKEGDLTQSYVRSYDLNIDKATYDLPTRWLIKYAEIQLADIETK